MIRAERYAMRQTALIIFAAISAITTSAWAAAPADVARYPSRPVRLVIPFPPGGGLDFLARLAAQELGQRLGQTIVTDNRVGASGKIGTELVANAAPDGYTLLLGFVGPFSILPNLEKVPYDPVRDFTAASMLASVYHVLTVHTSVPARSLKELIALAKAKPGVLSFASAGTGSPPHLVGELFKTKAGIDLTHIPYKGSGPAAVGVLSGEAQLQFATITAVMPNIRAKRLVALAVTSPNRSTLLPDVPTLTESGLGGVDVQLWYGLLVPAATPRPIVARLNAELIKIAAMPEYRQKLLQMGGMEVFTSRPEQFQAFMKADLKKWANVITAAGLKRQ